jgi:hypothetical protein
MTKTEKEGGRGVGGGGGGGGAGRGENGIESCEGVYPEKGTEREIEKEGRDTGGCEKTAVRRRKRQWATGY